jgi:hypothetical protein
MGFLNLKACKTLQILSTVLQYNQQLSRTHCVAGWGTTFHLPPSDNTFHVLPLTDEKHFDLDTAGGCFTSEINVRTKGRSYVTNINSYHYIYHFPLAAIFIGFPLCNKSKIKFIHSRNQIEHNKNENINQHAQDTTALDITVFCLEYIHFTSLACNDLNFLCHRCQGEGCSSESTAVLLFVRYWPL